MSDTDTYARTSLLKLVEHVFNNRDGLIQPVFYGELAAKIGRLNKNGDRLIDALRNIILGSALKDGRARGGTPGRIGP